MFKEICVDLSIMVSLIVDIYSKIAPPLLESRLHRIGAFMT